MATFGAAPGDGNFQRLFDRARVVETHTSAAAELGFLLGLFAIGAAPFAVMHVVALGLAALGAILAVVGVMATSRPNVSGRMLAPLGLVLALAAAALVGMRYLGVDTAFGDRMMPTITDWLENLNSRFPKP